MADWEEREGQENFILSSCEHCGGKEFYQRQENDISFIECLKCGHRVYK